MKKIIYLTKCTNNYPGKGLLRLDPDYFGLIKIPDGNIFFKEFECNKGKIVLLQDNLKVTDSNRDILNTIFNTSGNDIRLVKHTNQKSGLESYIKEIFPGYSNSMITKIGRHEPGDKGIFYFQLSLLFANVIGNNSEIALTDEIFNQIWKDSKFDIKNDLLNTKLTFLHKLLGGTVTQEYVDKELIEFGHKDSIEYKKNNESIRRIRDLILEGY